MSKLFFILALALSALVMAGGCATKSGSREYVPGKGWKQN
jgi:hypothetical protein